MRRARQAAGRRTPRNSRGPNNCVQATQLRRDSEGRGRLDEVIEPFRAAVRYNPGVPELQQAPAKKQRPRPSGDPSERDPWGETREGPRSGPLPQGSAPLAEPLRAHEDVPAVLARVAASLVLVAVVVHELQAIGMPGLQSEGAQIPTGLGGVALVEGLVAGRRRVRVAGPLAARARRAAAAVDPGAAQRP